MKGFKQRGDKILRCLRKFWSKREAGEEPGRRLQRSSRGGEAYGRPRAVRQGDCSERPLRRSACGAGGEGDAEECLCSLRILTCAAVASEAPSALAWKNLDTLGGWASWGIWGVHAHMWVFPVSTQGLEVLESGGETGEWGRAGLAMSSWLYPYSQDTINNSCPFYLPQVAHVWAEAGPRHLWCVVHLASTGP